MTEEEQEGPVESATERIARVLGRPWGKPLNEEERREFWAEQARIDEELTRRYGRPLTDEELQAYLAEQPRDRGRRYGPADAA